MAPPTLIELEDELKRDPRSRRFFELAREYQKAGRLAEAMGLCEKGLASYPNHWQARLLLAQLYVTRGNLEAGRDMVGKVLLAMHDSVPANHLAAEIHWALGDRERARKHFQIVDLLEPGRAGVRERLAELLLPTAAPERAAVEESPLDLQPLDEAPSAPAPSAAAAIPTEAPASAQEARLEFEPLVAAPQPLPVKEPTRGPEGGRVPEGGVSHEPIPEELSPAEPAAGPWHETEDHAAELEADTASFATVLDPSAAGEETGPVAAADLPPGVPFPAAAPPAPPETALPDEVPLSEEEFAPRGGEEGVEAGMNTFTLAELYERQGYPEKAVEIYQRMLLLDPENASIHARIRTLMQRMVGEAPEAPAVHQEDVEKALRQKRVLALQAWLRRVREGRNV